MALRFHLDEHVHPAILEGLRRRGVEVTSTLEVRLQSASDEQQLAHASSHGWVLVTQDQDFLRLHAEGLSHAGIVYSQHGRHTIGEVIRTLILLAENVTPDEMRNRLEFI